MVFPFAGGEPINNVSISFYKAVITGVKVQVAYTKAILPLHLRYETISIMLA